MQTNGLRTFFQGMVMGAVETIPGVSASTLALIMGIYDRFVDLLHDVSTFGKQLVKTILGKDSFSSVKSTFFLIDRKFGGYLIFGMIASIGVFSHIMSYLLHNQRPLTLAFFFGLVLASVKVPWRQISKKSSETLFVVVLSLVTTYVLLGLNPASNASAPSTVTLFLGGFFAICAMVLPGISGSFVLLLFGLYDYVIESVKDLTSLNIELADFLSLVSLGSGILLGFAVFIRFLKFLLDKFPNYLMSFLTGLMLASLRVLWPFIIETTPGVYRQVYPTMLNQTSMVHIVLVILVAAIGTTALTRNVTRPDY